jgi:hypothetical protein
MASAMVVKRGVYVDSRAYTGTFVYVANHETGVFRDSGTVK